MVIRWPATVTSDDRIGPAFGASLTRTAPVPVPLDGDGDAHGALLEAVQVQTLCVPIWMASSPPAAGTRVSPAATVYRHGAGS
jgi:hypothetical protein